ncbi:hypothetical protein LCGC14_0756580 [marine sediment metagenome]|uniref:Rhamnosyl O-methyltransferase n=1 Tax=marine sediment metagenome TaxID=412755 RepID=A0A0F9SMN3_9ZZZZ
MTQHTYHMADIISIADTAHIMPTGMGDAELAKNSESWCPYLRFLAAIVAKYQPPVCVELGVYMATATMHMALGSAYSMIIGVDRDFHPAAKHNVERFSNIVLIEGDSTSVVTKLEVADVLPWNRLNKELIGLLFLDSTHDGDTPKMEFNLYKTLFAEECLVVCDDLLGPKHLEVKMQDFWGWLPGEKQELHFLHPRINDGHDVPGFGVSIVRREDL